jgi:hypothetical protein
MIFHKQSGINKFFFFSLRSQQILRCDKSTFMHASLAFFPFLLRFYVQFIIGSYLLYSQSVYIYEISSNFLRLTRDGDGKKAQKNIYDEWERRKEFFPFFIWPNCWSSMPNHWMRWHKREKKTKRKSFHCVNQFFRIFIAVCHFTVIIAFKDVRESFIKWGREKSFSHSW